MTDYTIEDLLFVPANGDGEKTSTDMTIIGDVEMLGGFSIMHGVVPAKSLLAPHTHADEAQAVYVISGSLEMEVGGENGLRFTAPEGSYVLKPKGVEHAFWNTGDEDVTYIELNNGPKFAGFVRSRADGAIKSTIHAERDFDVRANPTRIPKLMLKNRLTGLASVRFGRGENDEA
ncbi:MAG: cupin domain-containing protein [Acidimicrobiia bacterium]|nr:cupin domain-containing protein [Acidimicrobiia bacterium]